jgi:hypothetical protein
MVENLSMFTLASRQKREIGLRTILILWSVLLALGFGRLFLYSNTPGEASREHKTWPEQSLLHRATTLPTLVIFAHPRCPCSRATIGELERLMPRIQNRMKVYVVFFSPKQRPENWAHDDLWQQARSIPGVETQLDQDGEVASRFDARTSGQTFLYDAQGELMFRGGITPERGHMGDSNGRAAILQFITTGTVSVALTPVFGCSLRNPERAPAGERL